MYYFQSTNCRVLMLYTHFRAPTHQRTAHQRKLLHLCFINSTHPLPDIFHIIKIQHNILVFLKLFARQIVGECR